MKNIVSKPRMYERWEVCVSKQGAIRSYVAYARAQFEDDKRKFIVVKGRGEAIENTLKVVNQIREMYPNIHTQTKISLQFGNSSSQPQPLAEEVKDTEARDIRDFEVYLEQKFIKMRKILPAVEVILSKKEFNTNDPGYQKPILGIEQIEPIEQDLNSNEFQVTQTLFNSNTQQACSSPFASPKSNYFSSSGKISSYSANFTPRKNNSFSGSPNQYFDNKYTDSSKKFQTKRNGGKPKRHSNFKLIESNDDRSPVVCGWINPTGLTSRQPSSTILRDYFFGKMPSTSGSSSSHKENYSHRSNEYASFQQRGHDNYHHYKPCSQFNPVDNDSSFNGSLSVDQTSKKQIITYIKGVKMSSSSLSNFDQRHDIKD